LTTLASTQKTLALRIPRHVAIIMDGNGRWAKSRGQLRWDGHSAGADSVRETVEAARRLGVEYLTLYAFSVNNWNRPRLEVEALMRLLSHFAKREQAELVRQDIKVEVAGSLEAFPSGTRRAVEGLMAATAHGRSMTLTLALSYGARTDLVGALQKVAAEVAAGTLAAEDVTEAALRGRMTTSHLPDVDLLIRTGGETRISDFLLFESAYAELCFMPVMWPEFREKHLAQAIEQFNGKERRFGLTSEQVEAGEVVRLGVG
jgi:undecaprenyl diphosphate synthase